MSATLKASPKRRLDIFLQYYRPHVSGLTNMAASVAEHAASNGFDVHVHCVSGDSRSKTSHLDGVTVHSYKKSFSLFRAVFSVDLLRGLWRLRNQGGIAHVHMPYPEAFVLAALFRGNWRIISTYHCDAPRDTRINAIIATALDWSHRRLIRRSEITVTSSEDYASNSRLRKHITENGPAVVPVTATDRAGGIPKFAIPGKKLIGFIGRPTYEKGIDTLIGAMENMPRDDVMVLFAGPTSGLSEQVGYDAARFEALVEAGRVRRLGFLSEDEIKDFYASLDLYVHPSINSFEAFGIVQLEAMSAGVPVVASDIPGVRTAVQETGFGELTRAGDESDLLRGLLHALDARYERERARGILKATYLSPVPENAYLGLYHRLAGLNRVDSVALPPENGD